MLTFGNTHILTKDEFKEMAAKDAMTLINKAYDNPSEGPLQIFVSRRRGHLDVTEDVKVQAYASVGYRYYAVDDHYSD
jgi:hypothetical protein